MVSKFGGGHHLFRTHTNNTLDTHKTTKPVHISVHQHYYQTSLYLFSARGP